MTDWLTSDPHHGLQVQCDPHLSHVLMQDDLAGPLIVAGFNQIYEELTFPKPNVFRRLPSNAFAGTGSRIQ
ncbi:hypothetical protein QSV77_24665 [Agrobacterium sp. V1]|nr:hypothetical protein [Agrobacterium sp. V1]MDO3445553.1 hypothetical protein [Agrobacterium sp. V1]